MLLLVSVITGMAIVVGRRAVVRHQLNSAVQTLGTDLARAKTRAIQTNSYVTIRKETQQRYSASGVLRELPGKIRFDGSSADSITFNGLGALATSGQRKFVLVDPYGESWELRVFVGGGHTIRKL